MIFRNFIDPHVGEYALDFGLFTLDLIWRGDIRHSPD